MRRIRNQKGFTMVELLVTVAILGIISGMSIPLIRNVRQNNEQRKYNSYGDSLVQAAKLYVDSYGIDLFGYKKTGCAIVTYQQLKDKGLIKEFSDKDITCNSDDTLVRVVKMNKQYGYSYQLYCGTEGSDGKATSPELKSSSSSKRVKEVIKKQNDDTSTDEDNDGFSDAACNIITSMDIKISPASGTTKAENYSPKVTLMSSTGINPSSTIQYAWVEVNSKDETPEINYNAITDWKTTSFTVDSQNIQMQQVLSPVNNMVLSKPKTIQTPSSAPAYYVLVLKIDNFRDLEGESWKDKDNPENQYKTSGIFNIGKKYTLTYDNNGGSGCSNVSVLKEKNVDTKWGDDSGNALCVPTKPSYSFASWNTSPDGTGTTITNDTIVENDITVYAQWRTSKVNFRIKIQPGEYIAPQTTETNGTVYQWAKNSDNYLTQSINGAPAKIYEKSIERGTNKTINLPNYNNTRFINITKTGYEAKQDAEWICESGCKTANQTFDHEPTITIANTDDICSSNNGDCTVVLKVNWKASNYIFTLSASGIKGDSMVQEENGNGATVNNVYISGADVTKSNETNSNISNIVINCTPTKGKGKGVFNASNNVTLTGTGTSQINIKPKLTPTDNYVINERCTATGNWGDRTVTASPIEFTIGNGWVNAPHADAETNRVCYRHDGSLVGAWRYLYNGEFVVGWAQIYWYNIYKPTGQLDWYYFFDGTETSGNNACYGKRNYAALGWCKNLPNRGSTSYQNKWVYFCDNADKERVLDGMALGINGRWCPTNALAYSGTNIQISSVCNDTSTSRTFNTYSFDSTGACTSGPGC